MAWTTPKTWTNEPFIAADMNTYVSDDLEALKDPPMANSELNQADMTTTSTSFTNVDSGDVEGILRHTITTAGGDVFISFCGMCNSTAGAAGAVGFNISVDGVDQVANDGFTGFHVAATGITVPVSFTYVIRGTTSGGSLAAGSHIFRLRWKVSTASNTATLYCGNGTSQGRDVHPQFWVRELS